MIATMNETGHAGEHGSHIYPVQFDDEATANAAGCSLVACRHAST
jgi:hypothetical protein